MKIEDKHIDKLFELLKRSEKISKLANKELSERVINEVWSNLGWGSENELLLNEMVERFDKLTGVKRDCDGNVIK